MRIRYNSPKQGVKVKVTGKRAKLYQQFLCSNIEFDEYSAGMRKVVLVNILLIISGLILLTFSMYNIFIHLNIALFLVDFIAFLVNIFIFYDLRNKQNIKRASLMTTLAIFTMMLSVVYFGQGENFTLVWTVFFPIFAIFLNGSKRGMFIAIVFYVMVFYITYQGLNLWQNGLWNEASYVRFVVASIGITIIVFFFEISFEKANIVLEKIRKKEQNYIEMLEEYAITDPLTHVYNRRYLVIQFDKLFKKAKKHNSYFALYIFDIDFFKQYNDTFGHIAGDTALQNITQKLNEDVFKRDVDYIFRLGGEEFCGLLISDELIKIQQIIEKARKAIESLQIKHPKNPFEVVTASFGVCVINNFEEKDFDKMYKIADAALYEAKEKGRNSIVGAEQISTL